MGLISVLSLIDVVGNLLALAVLPGATLGLMAATREASKGKFPMPAVLLSAFRAESKRLPAMLILGFLYAAGFVLVLGISATIDGGTFARLYLFGGELSAQHVANPRFEMAVLMAFVLYLPLSLLFWHAPALVFWHGVSPVKSLFFSLVACLRNFGAFMLYNLTWLAAFLLMGTVVAVIASLLDNPENISGLLFPLALLMAAMYFTSIDFTFRACFEVPEDTPDSTPKALPHDPMV